MAKHGDIPEHLTCFGERSLRLIPESIFPVCCLAGPALLAWPLALLMFGHFGFPTTNKAPASNTAVEPGDHHALPVPPRPVSFHSSPHDAQHPQGLSPSLTLCSLPLGYKGDRCYQANIWNPQREETMQRLLVAEYSEMQKRVSFANAIVMATVFFGFSCRAVIQL